MIQSFKYVMKSPQPCIIQSQGFRVQGSGFAHRSLAAMREEGGSLEVGLAQIIIEVEGLGALNLALHHLSLNQVRNHCRKQLNDLQILQTCEIEGGAGEEKVACENSKLVPVHCIQRRNLR